MPSILGHTQDTPNAVFTRPSILVFRPSSANTSLRSSHSAGRCHRKSRVPRTNTRASGRNMLVGGLRRSGKFADLFVGQVHTPKRGNERECPVIVAVKRFKSDASPLEDIKKVFDFLQRNIGSHRLILQIIHDATSKWSRLRHKNVLAPIGFTTHVNLTCVVTEWMYNGNVHEYMTWKRNVNPIPFVRSPRNMK